MTILTEQHARKVYHAMLKSRLLEAKISSLYKAGQIVGGVYLGKGQEAVSASVGAKLEWGKDIFAPLIRDQAGRVAFGEDILDCTRTYLGSAQGPMKGRDGNIHRGRPSDGLIAMISHLGTSLSVLGGMLKARQIQGKMNGCVGATCVGDGSTSTGAFHEGLNYIAVEKLPVVVVVADNQFAYSTPNTKQFACKDLIDRAVGYGVEGHSVDGTDVLACAEVIGNAVDAARNGEGPQMVVAKLLRLSGHGEHDDGSYVPTDVRSSHYGRDCIDVGKTQLLEKGWVTETELDQWEADAKEAVQAAVTLAQKEDGPDPYTEDWTALSRGSFRNWNS